MRPYLIFPMILPRIIHMHMMHLALPFVVLHVATSTYLSTMREVMR